METSNTTEAEKKASFEMSERYKRARAWVEEMRKEGGFTKKQAVYLVKMLNDFIPLF